MKPATVGMLVVVFFAATLTTSEALIYRVPSDGDSCRTWTYKTDWAWFTQWLQTILGKMTCPGNMVITADGRCVNPEDTAADRCINPMTFSQQVVSSKCASNPSAVFADPLNCTWYYDCSQTPNHLTCPRGYSFDDLTKSCLNSSTVLCNQRPVTHTRESIAAMCALRPSMMTGKSDCCNAYIDCSMVSDPSGRFVVFEGECTYPEMYDSETKSCKHFSLIDCKLRPTEKNPCALKQMRCGRSAHCMPCELNNPDCTDQPDGNRPIPLKMYTTEYVQCRGGWNIGLGSCEPAVTSRGLEVRIFDARNNTCQSIYNVPRSLGGLGPNPEPEIAD